MADKILLTFLLLTCTLGLGAATGTSLSDKEIVKKMLEVHQTEIVSGNLAENKADGEVKNLATFMVADHTTMKKRLMNLANKMGISETPGVKTKQIDKLKGAEGKQFESTYVETEVDVHEKLINDLSKTFIPQANDEELKKLLKNSHTRLGRHLEHAKKVRDSIKKQ